MLWGSDFFLKSVLYIYLYIYILYIYLYIHAPPQVLHIPEGKKLLSLSCFALFHCKLYIPGGGREEPLLLLLLRGERGGAREACPPEGGARGMRHREQAVPPTERPSPCVYRDIHSERHNSSFTVQRSNVTV